MKKDAFYFSHDSNAKDDPKCMLLIDQLGMEGYGIFWVLIETLRDQPEYKYPLKLVPILARRYNTTAEKMMLVVKSYNFFDFDEDENFFSLSLNERMQKLEVHREQRRIAGLKSGQARKQKTVERMLNDRSTSDERTSNENEQSKVKESKVKESKVKEIKISEKVFSDDVIEFTDSLLLYFPDEITEKSKNKDKDYETIDRLIRVDGETKENISYVVRWARQDNFWSSNFLSLTKLRKKNKDGIPYMEFFKQKIKAQHQMQQGSGTQSTTSHPSGYTSRRLQSEWEEHQARNKATAGAMLLNRQYVEKQEYLASLPDNHPDKIANELF